MKKRYIVSGALLVITILLILIFFSLRYDTRDRAAGEFGEDYARIAVYYPEGDKPSDEGINALRVAIDTALIEDSHTSGGRVWYDSFISFGKAQIGDMEENKAFTAESIAVGGDFFSLHELDFLSGTPFYSDDNYSDRVVIDEECSFKLYGSVNSVGMPLLIDGRELYVAGVFRREDSSAWEAQFGKNPVVILPDRREGTRLWSVYEIVMPDPVDSYAKTLVSEAAGDSVHLVDVTERFSLSALFENLAHFGTRSHVVRPIAFPWFENTSRGVEDVLSMLLAAAGTSIVMFSFSLVYIVIRRKK